MGSVCSCVCVLPWVVSVVLCLLPWVVCMCMYLFLTVHAVESRVTVLPVDISCGSTPILTERLLCKFPERRRWRGYENWVWLAFMCYFGNRYNTLF